MLSVLALALLDAPVYVYALVLLAWGTALGLWLRGDVEAALPPTSTLSRLSDLAEQAADAAGAKTPEPRWQNWVAGWYWETDAEGVLRTFSPGAAVAPELMVDWTALTDFVRSRPLWVSCWAAPESGADQGEEDLREGLGRMKYALDSQGAWPDALSLPWPAGLKGLAEAAPAGWTCQLRGEPQTDAKGRFQGFRGVLVPVPPPAAPAPRGAQGLEPDPADAQEAARMREAEQEALRYAISHDLRAPLRVVEGFTRIVKEDYGRALDRLGQDHLERVLAASARMNGMIDAILEQAQLSGARLQREPVDLTALAREIGGDLLATLPQGATVDLQVEEGLRIDADPQLVRRVLENLIGNAFKYSAKVDAPRVEVGVMPATNPAVFYVRDNGAGFDMQHADKLFGMFQRLHSAREFPGTGVGLAGVQNIIRRHGGRVWAEARPGEGACFYFTLMDTQQAQQRAAR